MQAHSTPLDPGQKRHLICATGLVVIGVVIYANSFDGAFVFDDISRIEDNHAIRRLWPPWPWLTYDRRPTAYLTFAANYALHGLNVWGYHAVNVAIHIAASLVLLGIVRRTLSGERLAKRYGNAAQYIALAVAAIWLAHPLQTQSVTYIVQRIESLMGLFFLLTLYCFIRSRDSRRETLDVRGALFGRGRGTWKRLVRSPRIRTNRLSAGWLALSVVCQTLAITTKEVGAMAPLVVLWYDRAFVAESWRKLWARRWRYYLALCAMWGLLAYLMISRWETYGGRAGVVEGLTPLSYALSQPGVLLHYLRLCFWPVEQCLDYRWPVAKTAGEIVPPLLVILALVSLTVWCMFRKPEWSFLGGWFFLILAPTSTIVPIDDLAFEHRMYLPLAAVVATAVVGVCELWRSFFFGPAPLRQAGSPCSRGGFDSHSTSVPSRSYRAGTAIGALLVTAVVACLGWKTHVRNRVYSSELRMWSDVVAKAPHNPRAHYNLGRQLAQAGYTDEAISHYRQALHIDPQNIDAHNNWGVSLQALGRVDEALSHYRAALRIDSRYALTHFNLGSALWELGRVEDAVSHYEQALESDPNYFRAHNNLGNALDHLGRWDEALHHYRKAIELEPDDPQAHNNLGVFYIVREGNRDLAVQHFRRALQLDPGFADAKANLRRALNEIRRTP